MELLPTISDTRAKIHLLELEIVKHSLIYSALGNIGSEAFMVGTLNVLENGIKLGVNGLPYFSEFPIPDLDGYKLVSPEMTLHPEFMLLEFDLLYNSSL